MKERGKSRRKIRKRKERRDRGALLKLEQQQWESEIRNRKIYKKELM